MPQQTETFDAIVVGSGISGGWAAKELTERGLRVLMLERGKNIEHRKGLSERTEVAVGVPPSRRPHARDDRCLPGPAA
jgi:choline dehydrogenase-like flavoprotein